MLILFAVLYGSELESRAEFEGVRIPGIITRCVQEVEARGKTCHSSPAPSIL